MATLRDIRRKISAVKKTQQITKAMNMVAAAKLRGTQTRMENFRPYAQSFSNMLGNLAGGVEPDIHPFFQQAPDVTKIGLQFLAGHAQTTWYTLLLAAAWAGFWVVVTKKEAETGHDEIPENSDTRGVTSSWEWLRRFAWVWGILALAVMVGAALAGVQLLLAGEYLLQSQRAQAVDYEFAMTYSFWPWRFLTLLAPGLFGNPVQGDYWGYANYWEDAVYIGLLPFLMAVSGNLEAGQRIRGEGKR